MTEHNNYIELVKNANIESHDKLKLAVQSVAAIKTQLNAVVEQSKTALAPIKEKLAKAQAPFKPAINAYTDAEKALKKKIADYVGRCYKSRDEALLYPNPTKQSIQLAQELIPPKIPGMSVTKKIVGIIEDPNKVVSWCYEYDEEGLIQPNEKAIQQYIQAYGPGTKIDGVRVVEERSVSITVKKVEM